MAKEFDNLNSLLAYAERDIKKVMQKEVAKAAKKNMKKAVGTAVYDKYTPLYYNRRKDNGGLSDINNMTSLPIENGIMLIDNAPLNNGRTDYRLDDIVVNRGVLGYPKGRDFYFETSDNLKKNRDFEEALVQGLKKKGYDIK